MFTWLRFSFLVILPQVQVTYSQNVSMHFDLKTCGFEVSAQAGWTWAQRTQILLKCHNSSTSIQGEWRWWPLHILELSVLSICKENMTRKQICAILLPRCLLFYPQSYASAVLCYGPVSVCRKPEFCRKWLNRLRRFLAQRLFPAYPILCCKWIRVSSKRLLWNLVPNSELGQFSAISRCLQHEGNNAERRMVHLQ